MLQPYARKARVVSNSIRPKAALGLCHKITRGIVCANFVLLVLDFGPFGYRFNQALRSAHLFDLAFYWWTASTMTLPAILILEAVLAGIQRRKAHLQAEPLPSNKAVWVDTLLAIIWIVSFLLASAHAAVGFL